MSPVFLSVHKIQQYSVGSSAEVGSDGGVNFATQVCAEQGDTALMQWCPMGANTPIVPLP